MISHIFSLITLVLVLVHLNNKVAWCSKRNRVIRIGLVVLSTFFSVLYLIYGLMSINIGFSILSVFKMEYGLLFIYMTYRLLVLNKAVDYHTKFITDNLEHRINLELKGNEDVTIEQLIKDTMICLEDEDFENALRLIDKVDTLDTVDQNIILLKKIVNQSMTKEELEYSKALCY